MKKIILFLGILFPFFSSSAIEWKAGVRDPYVQCVNNKEDWENSCDDKYWSCSSNPYGDDFFNQCLRNYINYSSPCAKTGEETYDLCKNKIDSICIERCKLTENDECINTCAKDFNSCSEKCSENLFDRYFENSSFIGFEQVERDKNKTGIYETCIDSCLEDKTPLKNCVSQNSHNTDYNPYNDCICDEGYSLNSKQQCEKETGIVCGKNSYSSKNGGCICKIGFVEKSTDPKNFYCIEEEKESTIQIIESQNENSVFSWKDLHFKQIGDFKIFAKKLKSGKVILIWKPKLENGTLTIEENEEEKKPIFQRKGIALFSVVDDAEYHIIISDGDQISDFSVK